jgi:hypothetical protein
MELLIISAMVGGLAVRLGHNRWWTWLLLATGLGAATYAFINFFQYLTKSSLFLAAACAGLGAILPDLGAALRAYLRRPRTISFLLIAAVIGGALWFGGTVQLQPGQQAQIGRMIGQLIAIAIIGYAIYMMVTAPFRKKKKKS